MGLIKKVFCGMEVKDIDPKTFTALVVMSDETVDRYDEVIEVEAWNGTIKSFMKHPILLSSHNYHGDLRSQLGEWSKVFIDGKKLMGIPKYYVGEGNPEADWAWKMVEKKRAAYSVGFIPKKVETMDYEKWQKLKQDGKNVPYRRYKEVELLETSHVLIPANPASLQKHMNGDEVMRSAAIFYFTHLDEIKGFGDIEVKDEDVAERFLIKGDTSLVGETIEESEKSADELDGQDNKEVEMKNIKELKEAMDKVSAKLDAFEKLLANPATVELAEVKADKTIEEAVKDIKDTFEASINALTNTIKELFNVKTVVPNESYVDNILDEKSETEDKKDDKSLDPEKLKSIMSMLQEINKGISDAPK